MVSYESPIHPSRVRRLCRECVYTQLYMAADELAYSTQANYAPLCVSWWLADVFGCPTGSVFTPPVAQAFLDAAGRFDQVRVHVFVVFLLVEL